MCEWEQSEDEEVWLEVEEYSTRANTGVVCGTCGAVNPIKHHMPRGKYSPDCPACRRKLSNRMAQRKFVAKLKQMGEEFDAAMDKQPEIDRRRVILYFNRQQDLNNYRIRKMEARVADGTAKDRTKRQLERRYKVRAYYEAAKEKALGDLETGCLRPLAAYLTEGA